MICTHISHEAIQYSGVVQGLNITPLYTFNLNGNLITDITPVDLWENLIPSLFTIVSLDLKLDGIAH
jgi:hypothetical protein